MSQTSKRSSETMGRVIANATVLSNFVIIKRLGTLQKAVVNLYITREVIEEIKFGIEVLNVVDECSEWLGECMRVFPNLKKHVITVAYSRHPKEW
nr:hypothetical protein [Candidatus Freyarchaeota archaeon]